MISPTPPPGLDAALKEVQDYLAAAAKAGKNVRCPVCGLRTHVNSPKYKYFNPDNPHNPRRNSR
jgi:hypothetical protein